jgi:adenosylmethionine-8-amino-7-oxononanoate aminotransferase
MQHPNRHADPLVVERAEGVWLHTADGRRVLDGMAGLWNVNIGYGNQELPEVAAEQMRKLAFTSNFVGMTNPPSSELADRLAGYAHPTLNTTFFTSGGSESNDSAFKTARYYWWRLGKRKTSSRSSRAGGLSRHHCGSHRRHRHPSLPHHVRRADARLSTHSRAQPLSL